MVLGLVTKRAQVSVFVILGILLVLGVSIYLHVTNGKAIGPSVSSVLEAPIVIRPAVQFITDCLSQAGMDAIIKTGARGGYPTAQPAWHVDSNNPTESDAITFSPQSSVVIPYWWYLKSSNKCTGKCVFSAAQRPALKRDSGQVSIEAMLDDAVASQLDECLQGFVPLSKQGLLVTAQAKPQVTTTITTDGVTFVLDYPIIAKVGGEEFRYSKYGAKVNVKLQEIYGLATELTELEAKTSTTEEQFAEGKVVSHPSNAYLERHILQVINSYTGLNNGNLPPISAATFDMDSGKRWSKRAVEKRVDQLISAYIPLLQVSGTANFLFREPPEDAEAPDLWATLYNNNMMIPISKNHPKLAVKYAAPEWWKPYFKLNCRGDVCAGDSFVNTFGFSFGFQKYNFAYGISAPVLVQITEPRAFNGRGFTFQYAMEANIRANQPMPVIDAYEPNIQPDSAGFGSQLCDSDMRTSDPITVTIVDGVTGNPVDGTVAFSCGGENCPVGSTTLGTITTAMPRCVGAEISVNAINQYSQAVPINTNIDGPQTVAILSYPIVTLPIDFDRLEYTKTINKSWLYSGPAIRTNGDQLITTFTRKDSDAAPYASVSEACGADPIVATPVHLVPGNFSVSMVLMYHDPITFPPQRRCATPDTCYFMPEAPMFFGLPNSTCASGNPLVLGTVNFDWEVTPEMLVGAKNITLHVPMAAIDKTPEDKREMEDMNALSIVQDDLPSIISTVVPKVNTE